MFAPSFQQPVSWQCVTLLQLSNNFPGNDNNNNNKPPEPKELFNQFLPFSLPSLLFPGQLARCPAYKSSTKISICFSNLQLQKKEPAFEFIRLHLFSPYILLSYPGHLSNSDSFFFGSWKCFSLLLSLSIYSSLKQSSLFFFFFSCLTLTVEVRSKPRAFSLLF